jgi:hypothetical protein
MIATYVQMVINFGTISSSVLAVKTLESVVCEGESKYVCGKDFVLAIAKDFFQVIADNFHSLEGAIRSLTGAWCFLAIVFCGE